MKKELANLTKRRDAMNLAVNNILLACQASEVASSELAGDDQCAAERAARDAAFVVKNAASTARTAAEAVFAAADTVFQAADNALQAAEQVLADCESP